MERLAELICILAVFLGVAILLWRWIERYSQTLWERIGLLRRAAIDLPPVVRLRRRFPWFWKSLGRRLSPEGYLGLHLTIGLVLILTALFLFADLAEEIWSGGCDPRASGRRSLAIHRAPNGCRVHHE
jgi:hypothetical protein